MKKIKEVLENPLLYIIVTSIIVQIFMYKTIDKYRIFADTPSYVEQYTENILKGKVNAIRTPVYPYFIKIIKKIGGSNHLYTNIVLIQKVLFIISIILFYFSLKKITKNKLIQILLALSYGICPVTIFWNTIILTEGITLIEITALLYLTVSYIKEHKMYQSVLIGVVNLLMVMTRPSNIYLPVLYFMFWIIRLFVNKEERKQILGGLISTICCIIIILGYCLLIYKQYGSFGLTHVSYRNNFISALESNAYCYADNKEIIQDINKVIGNKEDKSLYWSALQDLLKTHSDNEIEKFSNNALKKGRIEYFKYILNKTIELSNLHIGTIYTENVAKYKSINYIAISTLIIPINFAIVYIILVGTFIYLLYYLFKYRKIEWNLAILSLIIFGNIFISIVGAPFETQRLCLISIPCIMMLVANILEIYKENKENYAENSKKHNDTTNILYKIFIEKTSNPKLQFFRYIFVGGFAAVINIGSLFVFKEVCRLHYLIANIAGFLLGLLTNYILSKLLVFAKEKSINKIFEFISYMFIGIIGLAFDTLFIWIFTDLFGIYYIISKIISTCIVFIWNFFGRKIFYIMHSRITKK